MLELTLSRTLSIWNIEFLRLRFQLHNIRDICESYTFSFNLLFHARLSVYTNSKLLRTCKLQNYRFYLIFQMVNAPGDQECGYGPIRPLVLCTFWYCRSGFSVCSKSQCYLPFFFLKLMAWFTFWRFSSWFLRSILSYSSFVMKPISLLLGLSDSGSEINLLTMRRNWNFGSIHILQDFQYRNTSCAC